MTGAATRYIGAIDQGTTSTRFIVFDRAGETIASAQMEHRQIYPRPGWVEHDPLEIWRNTQTVIAEALRGADLTHRDLAAIGITNQRETTVLWDRATGEPVHNAVVWQDTRVDPLVAEFSRDGGQDRFRAQTGLPLASYFSGLKLRWLLDNVPDARRRAEAGDLAFGTIDSWLLWHFTGQHLTDVTNASRTQLMNLATLDWDDALLAAFGIPRAVLPRIVPSSTVYGTDQRRADRRHPRRSAGGADGPGLLRAGRGEEHLRHRLLPADEHRRDASAIDQRPGHHRCLAARRAKAVLRAGRFHRGHRRAGAVAARQSRADQIERRYRNAGRLGGRQRRRIFRAGVLRPLCAVVACRCARHDRRTDALCHCRPHRPRRAGGDRVPDARRDRGDAARFRHSHQHAARRRRHGGERAADAVPGGHPERAGAAPAHDRDHRAWCRLCGGTCRRLLARYGRSACATGVSRTPGRRR